MTRRLALLIGNTQFDNTTAFPALHTPANDVETLAGILRQYGNFEILGTLVNETAGAVQEAIEEFFSRVERDDLALLYYSGHGRRGPDGRHHLITRNSQPERLESTSVPESFIHRVLKNSQAQQRVIILDCCFSEAFFEGRKSGVVEPLLLDELQGQATSILASSGNIQYSFEEGGPNSLFTDFLIRGIESGDADENGDGLISVDELFHYAKKGMRVTRPEQEPKEFGVHASEILIAESPNGARTKHYQLNNIRTLLNDGFTDEELRRFCFDTDEFRQVYDELSKDTGKADIVDELVEYTNRRVLFDPLLAWAEDQNPAQFKKHQPYFNVTTAPVVEIKPPVAPVVSPPRMTRTTEPVGKTQAQKRFSQLIKCSASFYVSLASMVGVLPFAAWFLYSYLSAPTLEVKQLHVEFGDSAADAPPEGTATDVPWWVDTWGTTTLVKDHNRDVWVFVCAYGGIECRTRKVIIYRTPQGEVWNTSIQIGNPDEFCASFEVIFAILDSDMESELLNKTDVNVHAIEGYFLAPRTKFLVKRTLTNNGEPMTCEAQS